VEDLVTMLTCKSLVRVGHSGERPIEQSSSWLLLKFPPGKQILILYVVLFGKANEYEAWRYLLFSLYYQTLNVQTFYIINSLYIIFQYNDLVGRVMVSRTDNVE